MPLYAAEARYGVSINIGVAMGNGAAGEQYEALFSQADQALYRAKEQGKSRMVFYENGERR